MKLKSRLNILASIFITICITTLSNSAPSLPYGIYSVDAGNFQKNQTS